MVLISLFYLILFSCILYVGAAKVLQHDEKNHGILPVDKIRGLVIIKVIEQLTFEAVGSLRYLTSLKESRPAAALSGFFHIIVYLRNERMATMSMPNVSIHINDSYVVIGATSLAGT